MMKAVVLALLVGIAVATVIPQKSADEPNCGLKKAPKYFKFPGQAATSFGCEMCLDLVQIAEMYAECDEAYQQKKLDEYCANKLGVGSLFDKLCESLINDVMTELEKDTDADSSAVCTKILKSTCQYS